MKPEFRIWDDFIFYETANFSSQNFDSSFKKNCLNNKVFGEYSSLFALKDELKNEIDNDGLITICQYRRFVFNQKLGHQSNTMPWARVLTFDEITSLNIKDEYLPLRGGDFLIGSRISLPSVLQHYADYHFLRDILKFTSILIDLEILTETKALNFLNQSFLIPSPSCGTFSIKSFITIFEEIELAAKGFWSHGYRPYDDPYQSRVMGFLLERLNSFLLLSYMSEASLSIDDSLGITTLVASKDAKNNDVQKGLVKNY